MNSFVIIFEHYVTKQDTFSTVARIVNPHAQTWYEILLKMYKTFIYILLLTKHKALMSAAGE